MEEMTPEQIAKNNRAMALYQAIQILNQVGRTSSIEEVIDAAEIIYQYIENGKEPK